MKIEELLKQRQKEHGSFFNNAGVSQQIKEVIKAETYNYEKLRVDQKEALDAISSKISRIMVGDPHKEDHWRDIAGYATLVADRLKADDYEKKEANQKMLTEKVKEIIEEDKKEANEEMIREMDKVKELERKAVAQFDFGTADELNRQIDERSGAV